MLIAPRVIMGEDLPGRLEGVESPAQSQFKQGRALGLDADAQAPHGFDGVLPAVVLLD